MEKVKLEITWETLWRILLFGILVAILFLGRNVVLGLFLAIVISSGLEVAVTFFERRGIPRTLGVILLFLFIFLLFAVAVYFVVPLVIGELNTIFSTARNSPAGAFLNQIVSARTIESFSEILNRMTRDLFAGNVTPLAAFSDLFGGVGLAVAVVVTSFYLSLSHDGVERFMKSVFPAHYEEQALRIYGRARRKIGWWFQSQIVLSLIVGLLVWLILSLLSVPHAFLVGIMAGLFEIVPFVGPIVSGGVGMLFALSVSPALALYSLIAFLVVQQLESHVLVPLISRRVVDLHPVIVITSLLIGIQAGGLLGALLSVPVAAVLQEVIEERSLARREPAVVEPA